VESLWFKGAWAEDVIYAVLRWENVSSQGAQLVAERMLNIRRDNLGIFRATAIQIDP
jgi:hypothetical protein